MNAVFLEERDCLGNVGIGKMVPARTEGGGRGLLQGGQHLGGEGAKVDDISHEEPTYTEAHTIDALDALCLGLAQHADEGRIDYRGGTA
jgi:hypothetical protein